MIFTKSYKKILFHIKNYFPLNIKTYFMHGTCKQCMVESRAGKKPGPGHFGPDKSDNGQKRQTRTLFKI